MKTEPLSWSKAALFIAAAAACFHIAYTPADPSLFGLFIVGYIICLIQLARMQTARHAFYAGLVAALLCFAPQMGFLWTIFGRSAIPLWVVAAFWLGLFTALSQAAVARFGPKRAVLLIPFLWTGCEYFRSELYYLKFSWLNVGYAFSQMPITPFHWLGVYGIGFAIVAIGAWSLRCSMWRVLPAYACAGLLCSIATKPSAEIEAKNSPLHVVGIQLEFPPEDVIIQSLDAVVAKKSPVDLIVMSECTLNGPPSKRLMNWCRDNQKFLIVGGKDPLSGTDFYNTAFVIDPKGEIVFKQVKSVPVQFFKDGLPAPEQKLWDSPWGKIGICICYDLSYTRVTDRLARMGAQMLIVPTMDVEEWGRHEHELHARIAPVRAAEYGIPVIRIASSGISQAISRQGKIEMQTTFPGQGDVLLFHTALSTGASVPLDRIFLVQICLGITGAWCVWIILSKIGGGRRKRDAKISR